MTRSRKRKLQRSAVKWAGMPLASAVFAGGAVAQAQPSSPGILEEVVVTAQKRSEDLQKVPISLQVLGTEKLEQLQVNSFDDYAKFLPSVTFQSLGPGQAQLYFRGVASGGDGLHAGSLPATGLYLDETPVTTISGSLDIHVYDIARVEALAGPQGTLYGASSLSGTLRLITNKPDPSKFSASYDVKANKFGKGDGGGGFEGYVNIPLSDFAAVRLVGYYDHDGGYTSNLPGTVTYQRGNGVDPDSPITFNNATKVKNRFNDVNTFGGRAALRVDLNDRWSITPTLLYQKQKANGAFAFDPKVGDLKVVDFRPDYNDDHWYMTSLAVEGKIGNFDVLYSGSWFERQVDNASDYTGYTIAYDQFGSGYTRFTDSNGVLPPNQDPTEYYVAYDKYTKMSHEVRLSSPADNRFRFVTGAFYQRQTDNLRAEFRIDGLPSNWAVSGQPDILYLSQQDRIDRDYAVFGEGTFDFTDKFKMSAGIRQFWANNTLYGFFGFNAGNSGQGSCFTPVYSGANLPCDNTNKKVVESGETHKINLTYQIDPDRMVYGTYSTGFRPGGNNRRVEVVSYKSDRLTNFELGWKSAWFDRRVRWNGALFFEKWKGVQIGIQGVQGITSILNAGNAEVKGVESDINWLIMDDLTLSASGTYVKAEITTNFCPAPDGVVTSVCANPKAAEGTQLPVTPKFKANATARYKFNVGRYESFVQGSIVHQGQSTYSLEQDANDLVGAIPSFTTFDFSFGGGVDNWKLEAYIENVFDKRGQLGRVSQCGADYCYANARIYPIKPMLFGIKFGQKF